jgi:hypothetical protein
MEREGKPRSIDIAVFVPELTESEAEPRFDESRFLTPR